MKTTYVCLAPVYQHGRKYMEKWEKARKYLPLLLCTEKLSINIWLLRYFYSLYQEGSELSRIIHYLIGKICCNKFRKTHATMIYGKLCSIKISFPVMNLILSHPIMNYLIYYF